MRRVFEWVALFVFALMGPGCATMNRDSARWQQVTTPHFLIRTDLDEAAALEMAKELEETRAAILALAWPGAKDPPGITELLIARSKRLLRLMPALADGFASHSPYFPSLIVFSPAGSAVPPIEPHELTHNLSRWFLPVQPLWFAEGLAVYLETVRYDREKHEATMGDPPARWLPTLTRSSSPGDRVVSGRRRQLIPPTQLLEMERRTGAPPEITQFYYSSWLLTQYLLNYEGTRFGNFQDKIGRLVDWRTAWSLEFDDVMGSLDHDIVEAGAHPKYSVVTAKLSVPDVVFAHRPLSDAEVHGTIARVALYDRARLASVVRDESAAALRLDPNEINALAASFFGTERTRAERVQIAERATKTHPESAIAWVMQTLTAKGNDTIKSAAARALAADHYLPGALLIDAQIKIQEGKAAAALADTKLAMRLGALSVELIEAHGAALAANGRCVEVRTFSENRFPGMSERDLGRVHESLSLAETQCTRAAGAKSK